MTIGTVVMLFVWIVAICALAWLATWVIGQFSPPEPIGRIALVVIVVVAVVLIILLLVNAVGGGIGMGTKIGATSWFAPTVTEKGILSITSPALSVMDRA